MKLPLPEVYRTCYCPDCQKAETARQRKITFILLPIFAGAVWLLIQEITK